MHRSRRIRALAHAILAGLALACGGGAAADGAGAAGGAAAEEATRGVHRVPLQAVTHDKGVPVELYAESHALLIGASRYRTWSALPSVAEELDEVEDALAESGFSVERLVDPDARELVDGVRDFIDRHGYDPENRLLFYFSGHGHSVGDKGFLLPVDIPLPDERREFRRKALPMTQVLAWAKDMEAKHVLFVFDSCFAGSVFKSKSMPEDQERYIRTATSLPVRQFLTAGSANEEVPAKSTFTPAFVSAIRGEGDLNRDGYITGSELGVHLSQLVPQFVDQTPQYGKIRDYDLSRGDFVFFSGAPEPEPETSPAAVAGPVIDERLYAELPESAVEVMVWQAAERGDTLGEYEAYLERYPEGLFASIARARIHNLAEAPGTTEDSTDATAGTFFFEPEMISVPAGSFVMGSDEERENERPAQLVTVERFEIGKYEVTFEEFDRFTLANALQNVDDNGWGRGKRPVINVSWHLAKEYTRWLSSVTGRRYRLPVEAEWEYVARAGSGARFVSGDDPAGLCEHSNLSYKTDVCEDRFEFTSPVGDFASNPWGLHDLFGNVWEWTEDCWHPDYTGLPLNGRAWTRGGDCEQRVVRGGAWYSDVDQLRPSYRNRNKAASGSDSVGFRVVRMPDDIVQVRSR